MRLVLKPFLIEDLLSASAEALAARTLITEAIEATTDGDARWPRRGPTRQTRRSL